MMGLWLTSHELAWGEGAAPSLALEMTCLVPGWSCSVHKAQAWVQMLHVLLLTRAVVYLTPSDGGGEDTPASLRWQAGRAFLGSLMAHMACADLGVGLAANAVESSGKNTLSLGLAPSPDSATELDDTAPPGPRLPAAMGWSQDWSSSRLSTAAAAHGCWERSLSQRLGPRGNPTPPCHRSEVDGGSGCRE